MYPYWWRISSQQDKNTLNCVHISCMCHTVYPKKYAHGYCFAVLCCGYTLTDLPISIRLTSLALWQSNDCHSASKATLMNMDKYFMWIHYERLHNHNKAKHNKTVCIFLGIYCMCSRWLNKESPVGRALCGREINLTGTLWTHSTLSTPREEINGLVQDCSNSSALAMELLQSCTKPLRLWFQQHFLLWRHLMFNRIYVWYHSTGTLWTHSTLSTPREEINGLVQDCSNSSALAMELLQSCTKPLRLWFQQHFLLWRHLMFNRIYVWYYSTGTLWTHSTLSTPRELTDGLVQDCSNSSALAMELLQSCTKPLRLWFQQHFLLWRHLMFNRIYVWYYSTGTLWTHSTLSTPRELTDGLMQDWSNSSVLAMELLQSCTKPSRLWFQQQWRHLTFNRISVEYHSMGCFSW